MQLIFYIWKLSLVCDIHLTSLKLEWICVINMKIINFLKLLVQFKILFNQSMGRVDMCFKTSNYKNISLFLFVK
jgi:hypothetical protein